MPVGEQIKGRVFNVVGEPIDGLQPLDRTKSYSIHNKPPKFEDLSTETEGTLHRYQGHRFDRALFQRWKNRVIRWCRCG